jgi:hypothetical protein
MPSQGKFAQARAHGLPLSWVFPPDAVRPVFRIVDGGEIGWNRRLRQDHWTSGG